MRCRRPSVLPSFLAQLGLRSHLALLQSAWLWLSPTQPSSLICLAWDKQASQARRVQRCGRASCPALGLSEIPRPLCPWHRAGPVTHDATSVPITR